MDKFSIVMTTIVIVLVCSSFYLVFEIKSINDEAKQTRIEKGFLSYEMYCVKGENICRHFYCKIPMGETYAGAVQ